MKSESQSAIRVQPSDKRQSGAVKTLHAAGENPAPTIKPQFVKCPTCDEEVENTFFASWEHIITKHHGRAQ